MTTQAFVFDLPLYTKVSISENSILEDLQERIRIDGYNPVKGVDSTFVLTDPIDRRYPYQKAIELIQFRCLRYENVLSVLVHYDREEDVIEKVGQYPSVADIHIAQVKKYRKVLGESYIRDFTKAIGLAANGIGTGAFVYLRRIFEHLVIEIGEEAIKSGDVDRVSFESSKMDNKLLMLSKYLPEVITANKPLYGVLSAGIHSLSEDTCLEYFSSVRTVIELILDEREHARLMDLKKKMAKTELDTVAGKVKKEIKH